MSEVSCKVVRPLFKHIERRGMSFPDVIADLPYTMEFLSNEDNRLPWDDFIEIFERCGAGMTEEEMAEGGKMYAATPSLINYTGRLAGYFTSIVSVYRLMVRFVGPRTYRNVEASLEVLEKNRLLRVVLTIQPGYRDSSMYFVTSAGSLASLPTFIGAEEADVQYTVSPMSCEYIVTLPPSLTLWQRFSQICKAVFSPNAAIREMRAQHDELTKEVSRVRRISRDFKELIERSPNGVVLQDGDEIIYVNDALCKVLDVSDRSAVIGTSMLEWMSDNDKDRGRAFLRGDSATDLLEVDLVSLSERRSTVQLSPATEVEFAGKSVDLVMVTDVTKIRRLEGDVLESETREQQRLALEIHDGLIQTMTALSYRVEVLAHDMREAGGSYEEDVSTLLEINRRAVAEARSIAGKMDPIQLQQKGLKSALAELLASTESLYGLKCHLECDDARGIAHLACTHLFRIAQEATSNAARHSGCSEVSVSLVVDNGQVLLTVRDNGKGLPEESDIERGMGLRGMAYRARAMGGRLTVEPNSGGGTQIQCTIGLEGANYEPGMYDQL